MRNKYLAVLFVLSALVLYAGTASALTITSNLNPDTTSPYQTEDDEPLYVKYVSSGASFSYTFTAVGASGSVTWNLERDEDGELDEVYDSLTLEPSGTTATVSGVFTSEYSESGMVIAVSAVDSSGTSSGAVYLFMLWDSSRSLPWGNVAIPVNENTDEDSDSYYSSSSDVILTGNIVAIQAESLDAGVLDTIVADVASIDNAEDINFLTTDDIGDTYDPTQSMRQEASSQSLQYIAQFQSITVQPDNYYLFEIDFPDEYIGMSVESVRLQVADLARVQNGSVRQSQALTLLADRIFAGTELRQMTGKYASTIAGKMLILLFSNTGGSFVMFALRALSALLGGAGGCDVGGFAGSGLIGLIAACSIVIMRKRFRK